MSLGENIKKYRNCKGITQQKLGELIGVKGITIRKYESNEREPNIETLIKIAATLNVSLEELLSGSNIKLYKSLSNYTTRELLEELARRADK